MPNAVTLGLCMRALGGGLVARVNLMEYQRLCVLHYISSHVLLHHMCFNLRLLHGLLTFSLVCLAGDLGGTDA